MAHPPNISSEKRARLDFEAVGLECAWAAPPETWAKQLSYRTLYWGPAAHWAFLTFPPLSRAQRH
eukprot:7245229-Pyramimonas_sp.AAC.1